MDKTNRNLVDSDIKEMNKRMGLNKGLLYYLLYYNVYRNVFYYRIGKKTRFLRFFFPEKTDFIISEDIEHIGGSIFVLNHPYGSIINAKSIGEHFTICQLTTIGNAKHGRNDLTPVIGNNVTLGANVNIIGNITIGNNVIVGAGSVVVKDIPDNCVVAGNPARVIKNLPVI